jgi:hypothetical protein
MVTYVNKVDSSQKVTYLTSEHFSINFPVPALSMII